MSVSYFVPDPTTNVRLAVTVHCLCLVPDGGVLLGHTGGRDCCDDECEGCLKSSCFAHWGCYAGDGSWADAPNTDEDGVDWGFAEPGGRSALRAATFGDRCIRHGCHGHVDPDDRWCRHCGQQLNPRTEACPRCGTPEVLTPADRRHGYQCDRCADRAEGVYRGADY